MKKGLIFILILIMGAGSLIRHAGAEEAMFLRKSEPTPPPIMVWAWERPEDLSFVDPREVGVAFLSRTIHIRSEGVHVCPRLQPLRVPEGAYLTAVVRIETERKKPLRDTSELRPQMTSAIIEAVKMRGVSALQIDFDAKVSERAFYRALLQDMRRLLPKSIALSITALASWCLHDDWLSGLPVDEVVPMLFRVGPDRDQVFFHLEKGGDFAPICRRSIGISTDEGRPRLPPGRRLYLFHPGPWSEGALRKIMSEVRP